jgi:cation diffusion facilitator CzcD-associated flavoprotein CzcO
MTTRDPAVAVVGAGMSGLCVTIALLRSGITDVTIFEKADELGGTWRENTYPGLVCDIPSRVYQYTFARNPNWSHLFSPGGEIQAYFRGVADQLRADVAGRRALSERGAHTVADLDGGRRVVDADALLLQTGQELLVSRSAGVGGGGRDQGGQAERAGGNGGTGDGLGESRGEHCGGFLRGLDLLVS